jgi:hypothetical protein
MEHVIEKIPNRLVNSNMAKKENLESIFFYFPINKFPKD